MSRLTDSTFAGFPENDLGQDAPEWARGLVRLYNRSIREIQESLTGRLDIENLGWEYRELSVSHGVEQSVSLQILQNARGALIVGARGQVISGVEMRPGGSPSTALVKFYFYDTSATNTPVGILFLPFGVGAGQAATVTGSATTFGSPVNVGLALADGVATTAARSDHVHAGAVVLQATTPGTQQTGNENISGTAKVGTLITDNIGSSGVTNGRITQTIDVVGGSPVVHWVVQTTAADTSTGDLFQINKFSSSVQLAFTNAGVLRPSGGINPGQGNGKLLGNSNSLITYIAPSAQDNSANFGHMFTLGSASEYTLTKVFGIMYGVEGSTTALWTVGDYGDLTITGRAPLGVNVNGTTAVGKPTSITLGTGTPNTNGNSGQTATGGAGANYTLVGGAGGAASTGPGGGGSVHTGGAGGALSLTAGAGAGAASGTTNNGGNGGGVTVDAGAGGTGASANGTPGSITIGGTNADSIAIGRTGKTTTVSGSATVAEAFRADREVRLTKRTTVADAGYTALSTDYLIAYTSISAARTVTVPTGAAGNAGQIYVIKDESGSASAVNTITVAPVSGNIDGAATKAVVLLAYGAARIYSNGTDWFTF